MYNTQKKYPSYPPPSSSLPLGIVINRLDEDTILKSLEIQQYKPTKPFSNMKSHDVGGYDDVYAEYDDLSQSHYSEEIKSESDIADICEFQALFGESLQVKIPLLISLEMNNAFLKKVLIQNSKVTLVDDMYYFEGGKNNFARDNLNFFLQTAMTLKIYKQRYFDPTLSIYSIIRSKDFNKSYKEIEEYYKKDGIKILCLTSKVYYSIYEILSAKSKKLQAKLLRKDPNIGFIKVYISSKTNPKGILGAHHWLKQTFIDGYQQDYQYIPGICYTHKAIVFNIKAPQIEDSKPIRKEIIEQAKKSGLPIKLIARKNVDYSFIEGFYGAICFPNAKDGKFDFRTQFAITSFCDFLKKFTNCQIMLRSESEILAFKLFLQEKYENRAKTMGIEIKLDENSKLIKFSSFSNIIAEISEILPQFSLLPFEFSCVFEIKDDFGQLKTKSPFIFDKIYENMMENLTDFKKIGRLLLEKIAEINEKDKNCKICESRDFFQFQRNKSSVSIKTKAICKNKIANLENKKVLIENFLKKLILAVFTIDDPSKNVEIDEGKIYAEFSCSIIKLKGQEYQSLVMIYGKAKNVEKTMEYLDSKVFKAFYKRDLSINTRYVTYPDLFKTLKFELKSHNLLEKSDKFEIKNNTTVTLSSYDKNIDSSIAKISDFIKTYEEKDYQEARIEDLALNQIEFLQQFPAKLKKEFKVEISISQGRTKNVHFEFLKANKRFFLLNNRIEEETVNGIINPHSEVLLNTSQLSEGVNSALLTKAGKPYELELAEFYLKNGKLAKNQIFTSSSGKMLNCSKILNISVPKFDKNMKHREDLAECFQNIIRESERQKLKSIAMPLLGCGVFGFDECEVFEVILRVLQEELFGKELEFLEEINICEVDQNKIQKIKDLCCKLVKQKEIKHRELKYRWHWLNDQKIFEEYDAEIAAKIDEAYEKFQQDKQYNQFEIYFNVCREPGTHLFDLKQMVVIDKAKHKTQSLKKVGRNWYHDTEIYSNQINEILNINTQMDKMEFELFLKEYVVDFGTNQQRNVETGFLREIKKTVNLGKAEAKELIGLKLIDFERICIYSEEKTAMTMTPSVVISGYGSVLEAKGWIEKSLKENFEELQMVLPGFINDIAISKLKSLCFSEKISLKKGEFKPDSTISFVGSKKSLKILQIELGSLQSNSIIFPWNKVSPKDFNLLELKNTDPEYIFVHDLFKQTMSAKINSITQIQNKDLFKSYQNKIKSVLDQREKKGFLVTENDKKELWLWHGSKNTDPLTLVDNYSSALSTQFAEKGMWGNGIYFAENASYSNSYAFKKTFSNTKYLLLCKVFVGDAIELMPDSNLRMPPFKDEAKKIRYDSVKGVTGGSVIYAIYGDDRNYPFYVVEYEV